MPLTRVRVKRDRPAALSVAAALCVTMLAVYVLTLDPGAPNAVQSVAAAPRVTREVDLDALEGWCVAMARCETRQEAGLQAAAWAGRGAAGCVTQLEDAWVVLGAVYDSEKEASRIAGRLKSDEGIPAEAIRLSAGKITLRVTAPERQIEAIAGANALLHRQRRQLGDIARQLDRGEIRPDAARTLCALAATEAGEAAAALRAIPGAPENGLCAGLTEQLDALKDMQDTVSGSAGEEGASLSGMLRCAQIECFISQWRRQKALEE